MFHVFFRIFGDFGVLDCFSEGFDVFWGFRPIFIAFSFFFNDISGFFEFSGFLGFFCI